MIGGWVCLIWDCAQKMQERSNQPGLCSSKERSEFSHKLKEYLHISADKEMGFESVTLALMEIHPAMATNELHKDLGNCSFPCTSRTGAMNICLTDPGTGRLYLLQIILNFRHSVTAFYKGGGKELRSLVCKSRPQDAVRKDEPVPTIQYYSSTSNPIFQWLIKSFWEKVQSEVTGGSTKPKKESFVGTTTLPSDMHLFTQHTMFCYEVDANSTNVSDDSGMKVLQNANFGVEFSKSTSLDGNNGGLALLQYLRELTNVPDLSNCPRFAGVFNLQHEEVRHNPNQQLSYYPAHVDKKTFNWVAFIPLTGVFWTIVAIPDSSRCFEDMGETFKEQTEAFNNFERELSAEDQRKLGIYKNGVHATGQSTDRNTSFRIQPLECKPGTILCFEASKLVHGTITLHGFGLRNLLVLHQFVPK